MEGGHKGRGSDTSCVVDVAGIALSFREVTEGRRGLIVTGSGMLPDLWGRPRPVGSSQWRD